VGSSAVNGVTVWASPSFPFPPPAGGKLRRSKGGQKHSAAHDAMSGAVLVPASETLSFLWPQPVDEAEDEPPADEPDEAVAQEELPQR
jgi:hypothetical protein